MALGAQVLWTQYEPRTAIKGQVLADFIADFTPGITDHADQLEGWILNVDGASNSKGAAIEIALITPKGPSSNSPLP